MLNPQQDDYQENTDLDGPTQQIEDSDTSWKTVTFL